MIPVLFTILLTQAEVDASPFGPSCQEQRQTSCVVIWGPRDAKSVFETVCVRIDAKTNKIMWQWPATETEDGKGDEGQPMYRSSCPGEPWFPWFPLWGGR